MNKQPTADRERFWGRASFIMTIIIAWILSGLTGSEAELGWIFIFPFLYLFLAITFALSLKLFITNIFTKEKVPATIRKQRQFYSSIGVFAPLIVVLAISIWFS